jgi:prepilin-type N-terminal cleavage/methylation domain-containing protein
MRRWERGRSGLTLLEVLVVVALLGVLLTLSWAAAGQLGSWAGPQNAASDLSGALSQARARAIERGADVWLILYEDIDAQGNAGRGHGAWFLLEDRKQNFLSGANLQGEELTYAMFRPPAAVKIPTSQGQLLETMYMDSYPQRTVRFGVSGNLPFDAPFSALPPRACSFCGESPGGRRGAAVFTADGSVRFLNGQGAQVTPSGTGLARRVGTLGLISADGRREYLYAISGPVGFVGVKSR